MVDLKVIGGKILSSEDIKSLNQQEIKNRKYKYCTIDCGEHGQYLAKVAYSESTRAWGPTEVEYDGEWMTIEEFEDTTEGGSYSCENYRIVE